MNSLSLNRVFEGRVRDISGKGMGVVDHPDGRVFFVPGTWPGDLGRFTVESIEKRYGFARLKELIEASPDRVSVPCPYLGFSPGLCGGCPWMMASYPSQLKMKEQIIHRLLTRSQALSEHTRILPILASSKVLGYRNRAQFKTDGLRLGFVSTGSHHLAEIDDCLVLTDQNRVTLRDLRSKLPEETWRPQSKYRWNYIEVDESVSADTVAINKKLPFKQGNSEQNLKMKEWLKNKLLAHSIDEGALELFAGSGNFTEVLVDHGFSQITAVEVVDSATEKLRQKSWPQVEALTLNLYSQRSWHKLKKSAKTARVLVLDPPRDGFKEIVDFLSGFNAIDAIYYISCEPNYFARDAIKLHEAGWQLLEVQPLDQFPHTPHVELLSEFRKAKRER